MGRKRKKEEGLRYFYTAGAITIEELVKCKMHKGNLCLTRKLYKKDYKVGLFYEILEEKLERAKRAMRKGKKIDCDGLMAIIDQSYRVASRP